MRTFRFGERYEHRVEIKAKSIEMAIKIFKVQELFPEKYVDEKYEKK